MNVVTFAARHGIELPETLADTYARVPVVWNRRLKVRAGQAKWVRGDPSIELNPQLKQDPAALRETFLHELAHVIAGREAGHGPVWRDTARVLGCSGERCHNVAAILDNLPVKIICTKCGPIGTRARVPTRARRGATFQHVGCGAPVHYQRRDA